jgi:hypothetical protein
MPRLSWLHLTDLHFGLGGQPPLWPNVREAFFEHLARTHDRTGPRQVVLFSGDFVQQGSKDEFQKLEEKVLAPLWARMKELGSEPYLLAVPGNHDLVRPDVKKPTAALQLLLLPNGFPLIADRLFEEPLGEYREVINQAFANYTEWWRRTPYRHPHVTEGLLPGEFSVTLEEGGARVGVVGLNTTFLQLAGGDYQGRLAWDVRQFLAACTGDPHGDGPSWVRDHDVCLLMTHQGPEWLDERSRNAVYSEINPAGRFAVHLFGHMHENVARASSFGGGETLRHWQGSSLFGLEKFGDPPRDDRRHGYSAGTIDFNGSSASLRNWPSEAVNDTINPWRFEKDSKRFVLDEDGGTRPVVIPIRARTRRPSSARPDSAGAGPALSIGDRQALDAYIQAARKLWDIVDLAGLPEDDRHLAMQRFVLRQLFVPLRLTVEAPAHQEWSDDAVQQLEQRRQERRLTEAGRGVREGLAAGNEPKKYSIGERLRPVIIPPKRGRKKGKQKQTPAPPLVPRLVILGDPGGGKTTLLRWLATAYLMRSMKDPDFAKLPDAASLPEKDWLPVLIRCRDLDRSRIEKQEVTIDDVLRQSLSKLELNPSQVEPLVTLLRRMVERGEVLLLVDGLDEITDPQLRSLFCGWIETVAERFPSPLVATSRIVGYREMKRRLRGGFEHATLADLTPEDKDEFVRRWCEVTIPEPSRRQAEADKLRQAIHGPHSDRIERLTGNPMLLTTLALVQRKVGKLPSKRHKLYWEAVGVLLNWRADVDEPIDADEALPQLQYVAYAMCDRGVQRLRRDELLKLLEGVRTDYPHIRPVQRQTPEAFLAQLERRTGLLVETGHEQHHGRPIAVYEFRHLTFQEYLAALALVEGRFPGHEPTNSLAERVGPLAGRLVEVEGVYLYRAEKQVTENWRETLRLCVACCNDDDVDSTLRAILDGGISIADATGDSTASRPSRPVEGDNEPRPEGRAGQAEARARAILAALCLADEPNVSEPTALSVIQRFAAHVGKWDGIGSVTTGLDRAAMELAHSVWRDPLQNALIHEFQARGPENRERPGGLCAMVGMAGLPDNDPAREAWLSDRIAKIGSSDLDMALVACLCIMNYLFYNKIKINKHIFMSGLVGTLIGLLHRSPAAAHAATWTLWWFFSPSGPTGPLTPTPAAFARLKPFLDTTTDGPSLYWLCEIAGKCRAPEAIHALLVALGHSFTPVRRAAASALGEIGDPSATSGLRACLQDSGSDVRSAALKALAQIRGDDTVKSLLSRVDPQAPINASRVTKVAKRLGLSEKEVRRRYEVIASDFGLTLTWQAKE